MLARNSIYPLSLCPISRTYKLNLGFKQKSVFKCQEPAICTYNYLSFGNRSVRQTPYLMFLYGGLTYHFLCPKKRVNFFVHSFCLLDVILKADAHISANVTILKRLISATVLPNTCSLRMSKMCFSENVHFYMS